MRALVVLLLLCDVCVLIGQDGPIHWEAVSIKAVSAMPNGRGPQGPDLFSRPFATVNQLLTSAYTLPEYRIVGGPSWVASDRFQILAKASSPTTREQMRVLVQQLLAERFRFTGHRESRELPTYDLVLARSDRKPGPNLKPAPVDCTPFLNGERPPSEGPVVERGGRMVPRCGFVFTFGNGFLSPMLMGRTMQQFADYLSRSASRDVIDKTGLTGAFDLDLTYADETSTPFLRELPKREAPALFTALQEQLGLKLASSKAVLEVLVIDHIERPSEN